MCAWRAWREPGLLLERCRRTHAAQIVVLFVAKSQTQRLAALTNPKWNFFQVVWHGSKYHFVFRIFREEVDARDASYNAIASCCVERYLHNANFILIKLATTVWRVLQRGSSLWVGVVFSEREPGVVNVVSFPFLHSHKKIKF